MKKLDQAKLSLSRETLHALDRGALDQVGGAQGVSLPPTLIPSICPGGMCDRAKSWIQACPR